MTPASHHRRALAILLALASACGEPVSTPHVRPLPDAAAAGVAPGPGTWAMSFIGTKSYYRINAFAINDSGVVVGGLQHDSSSSSIAFRAARNNITELSFGPHVLTSVARGINNAGTIVGWTNFYEWSEGWLRDPIIMEFLGDTAFVRSPAGVVTSLPTPASLGVAAYDVNDAGWIVGFRLRDSQSRVGGFWVPRSGTYTWQEPPELALLTFSELYQINNVGDASGVAIINDNRAIRASLDSVVIAAPVWPGFSEAYDIDDRGTMVGQVHSGVVLFPGFGVTEIGIKGSAPWMKPRLNNHNRVISTELIAASSTAAVTFRHGLKESLPPPLGATASRAMSLNTCGTIAGTVTLTNGLERPVLWRRMKNNTQVCDL